MKKDSPFKLLFLVIGVLGICFSAATSLASERTDIPLKRVEFSFDKFQEPDSVYWPGYFWWWNGPLKPEVLAEQLQDMKTHDARSVCPIAMPYEFRPTTLNNQMDVNYLSPEFFDRVKIAVKEASRLGMNYWLYDEGGWPSGEACGQVVEGHPELLSQVQQFDEKNEKWEIAGKKSVDRMNPQATERFINLTHQKYKETVGEYFGGTIKFAFTDEPAINRAVVGKQIPWTDDFENIFEKRFGYRPEKYLDVFRKTPEQLTADDMRIRADFFDCWSQCFRDAYFLPIRKWCRQNGILAGGHLDNDDVTAGAIDGGYGNILRQLRAEDVPGVDAIWRQIFPGQKNHYFPMLAASAAHQIGSPYAFSESFVVYGNGLTPEQMKWITNYQYVRGITLTVAGSYPLSTNEHLMSGLRPHLGTVNPLWDFMPAYHRYTARLGYVMSCGQPKIDTAVYLPVRDMWATGAGEKIADEYDGLVEMLLEHQCGFDFIDDDILADERTKIKNGRCQAGAMMYKNIIFHQCSWLKKESVEKIAEFVRRGGKIFCVRQLPAFGGDNGELFKKLTGGKYQKNICLYDSAKELASKVQPLVRIEPACAGIRIAARKLEKGNVYFIFNEGGLDFSGEIYFDEGGSAKLMNPETGEVFDVEEIYHIFGQTICWLDIPAGGAALVFFGKAETGENPKWEQTDSVELADGWQGRIVKQYDIGKHDYEIKEIQGEWKDIRAGQWRNIFSRDFSGTVVYKISIPVKKQWKGMSMRLSMGRVEYAANVRVNGVEAGRAVWSPWQVDIKEKIDTPKIDLEIAVSNTLANVLTSEKVRTDWNNRGGDYWPGRYDSRTVEFEKDSCGGGLIGPVVLEIGSWRK